MGVSLHNVDGAYDVEFRAVTKRFGSLAAVDAVSLKVRKGEFLSLLGPSGCGKTTSLRLIAGFEQPDEGEILIGGVDAVGTPRTDARSTPSSSSTPCSRTCPCSTTLLLGSSNAKWESPNVTPGRVRHSS